MGMGIEADVRGFDRKIVRLLLLFQIVRWVYSSLPMSIYCWCCVYGDFGRWKRLRKKKRLVFEYSLHLELFFLL